jgi:hypothetical protein
VAVALTRPGKYVGEGKDGNFHGRGKYTSKDNRRIYDGEWKDGLYHGEGFLVLRNE